MKYIYCLAFLLLFISKNIFAQTTDSVIVLPVSIAPPADAKKLGTIKVGNNATRMKCDYEEVISDAKMQARAIGGNIVKITHLLPPAFVSKCYKIEADVYAVNKLPVYAIAADKKAQNTTASANEPYALLCVYRLKDSLALAGSYKLHIDEDSTTYNIRSRSHDSVKVYKEGPIVLWAQTEKRTELKLDVKYGTTYYIRCGAEKGSIRMVPVLEHVNNDLGAKEYKKLTKGKKDTDATYLQEIH